MTAVARSSLRRASQLVVLGQSRSSLTRKSTWRATETVASKTARFGSLQQKTLLQHSRKMLGTVAADRARLHTQTRLARHWRKAITVMTVAMTTRILSP